MEPSQEMSLSQKIAAARETSKAQVIEKDVKSREKKSAERAAKREAFATKVKELKEKVTTGVKNFREWDRTNMLNLFGDIKAAPEIAKITVETGIDKGKKYAQERRDELVKTGKEVQFWVEDRIDDVKDFAERQKNRVVDSVEMGIDKAKRSFEQRKAEAVGAFLEGKKYVTGELTRGKNTVVEAWRRRQKDMAEERAVHNYERYSRQQEKADRMKAMFEKSNENVVGLTKSHKEIYKELHS